MRISSSLHHPSFRLSTCIKTFCIAGCVLIAPLATAEEIGKPSYIPPGITLAGLLGSNAMGYADVMVPVVGHSDQFLHLNPQALIHNGQDYSLSLGTGFRRLTEKAGILGAYVFGDYNHSPRGNSFWFISPGLEALGNNIDVSANLYIPVGDKRKDFSTIWGSQTTTPNDYVVFAGHSQFDPLLSSFESTGTGADAEIGVHIPVKYQPTLYVGGYYFNPKDAEDKNQGLTARVETPLTDRLTIVLSDSYDKVEHNTAKIGLQYAFGSRKTRHNFSGDLAERMVDPIRRNLIAVSGPARTGQPITETDNKVEAQRLVKDHIAFFDVNSTQPGDGSYEKPFQQMTQSNVDAANAGGNTNLYVNTGTYAIGGSGIQLTNDAFYGRQSDNGHPFVFAAEGDNRPLFQFDPNSIGTAFTLNGTNNVFDSVRLAGGSEGSPGAGTGIFMGGDGTQNIALSIQNTDIKYFDYGVVSNNVRDLDLVLSHSHFEQNGHSGLRLLAAHDLNAHIDNTVVNGNGLDGFHTTVGNDVHIEINTGSFNDNGDQGLEALAGHDIEMLIRNATVNGNLASFSDTIARGGFVARAENDLRLDISHASFNDNVYSGLIARAPNNIYLDLNDIECQRNRVDGIFVRTLNNDVNIHVHNALFNQNKGSLGGSGFIAFAGRNLNIEVSDAQFNGSGADGFFASAGNNLTINAQNASFNDNVNRGFFARASNDANVYINNAVFERNNIGLSLQKTANPAGTFTATVQNSSFTQNNTGVFGLNTNPNPSGSMIIDLTGAVFPVGSNGSDTNQTGGDRINWTIPTSKKHA